MSAGGIGALVGASNSAIQGGIALKQAKVAWRRQKRVLQNQIQWRVADLRKAGLNPILAASSGLGAGGAPSVQQASLPDFSSGAARGAEAGIKAWKARAERDQVVATTDAQKGAALQATTGATLNMAKRQTEHFNQKMLGALTEQHSAQARQADALTAKLRYELPKMKVIGDTWTQNPKIMRAKYMASGVSVRTPFGGGSTAPMQ